MQAIYNRFSKCNELHTVVCPVIAHLNQPAQELCNSLIDKSHKIVPIISIGFKVMVDDSICPNKWSPVHEGPFTVHNVDKFGSYTLLDETNTVMSCKYTIDMLQLVQTRFRLFGTPNDNVVANTFLITAPC